MNITLAIGLLLLAGAAGGKLARIVNLPSVTGNLVAGILIGPSVFRLVDYNVVDQMAPINELALGVIALSIGAELHWRTIQSLVADAAKVFIVEALLTCFLVFGFLALMGLPLSYALVLGIISIATAPGAIIACLRETPVSGNFSRVLLAVVALDNLLAIVLFGVVISFLEVGMAAGPEAANNAAILRAAFDIGVSVLLGIFSGFFLFATARWANSDNRILVSVLGAIMVTVGLANLWEVPALLAAIVAGAFYVNVSRKPQRISRSLLKVEDAILLAFLTLAGVKLDLAALPAVGQIGLIYIAARFIAKLLGSRLGTAFTGFPMSWKHNLGRALTPQAGVAIGLAIIAEQKSVFEPGSIMPVVLAAVVVFELVGPLMVRKALCDVGDAQQKEE